MEIYIMPTFETEQEYLGIEYDELEDNLDEYVQVQQGYDIDTVEITDYGYFEIPEGYYGQIDDNDCYEEYYIVKDFENGIPTTDIVDRLKQGKYRIVGNHIIKVDDVTQMYYFVPSYPISDNFSGINSNQSENTGENGTVDIEVFMKKIEDLDKEEQLKRIRQEIENITLDILHLEYLVNEQRLRIELLNKDIMEGDYDDDEIQWYENEMSNAEAEKKTLDSQQQPWDVYYYELLKLQEELNDDATSY